jgi:hypothetical protein
LRVVYWFLKSLNRAGLLDHEMLEQWLREREAVVQGISSMPETITLTKQRAITWRDPDRVEQYRKTLKKLGAQRIGQFAIDEFEGFVMEAWLHHDHDCYAIISQHPQMGVWFELSSTAEDDTGFTVTDGKKRMATLPPWQTTIHLPSHSPQQIVKRFLHERPDLSWRVVDAPLFAKAMRRSYKRETAWRKKNV